MNVKQIPILNADADELLRISQEGLLSLNLAEMQAIQAHFAKLERNPTDVELETIAQTWSEHCVHKTFKSMIEYTEKGRETEMVDGLFKTYIQRATEEIAAEWWSPFSPTMRASLSLMIIIISFSRSKHTIIPPR